MLPAQLDAVLFDAGGTLVHLDYACMARIVQRRGVALSESELRIAERASRQALDAHYRAAGSVTGTDATRREGYFGNLLRAAGVEPERARAIIDDLEVENVEANLWRVPLAEAAETLQGLRARGASASASSSTTSREGRNVEAA